MSYPILDIDVLIDTLNSQKLSEGLATFDEYIANSVRGPRDIVFNPEHGILVIDHEGAMDESTQPDSSVTNWLADRLLERMDEKQRPQFMKRLRTKVAQLQAIQMGPAPTAVQFDQRGVPLYNELVNFLSRRLAHLDRLLSERVFPGQIYIKESSEDASGRASDI